MQRCPKCNSERIHRSRSRTTWERWRKEITGKRIFRCHECDWRGWGDDPGPTVSEIEREIAERALVADPPNLERAGLARGPKARDDVRFHELDAALVRPDENAD